MPQGIGNPRALARHVRRGSWSRGGPRESRQNVRAGPAQESSVLLLAQQYPDASVEPIRARPHGRERWRSPRRRFSGASPYGTGAGRDQRRFVQHVEASTEPVVRDRCRKDQTSRSTATARSPSRFNGAGLFVTGEGCPRGWANTVRPSRFNGTGPGGTGAGSRPGRRSTP